jgi:hypothetical protein
MQSSLHTKEVTTAQVAAVSFGFFNDEEVGVAVLDTAFGGGALRAAWRRPGCYQLPLVLPLLLPAQPPSAERVQHAEQANISCLQVRKISVKQVVAPMIFDNMRTAVKGGLYDPAFGPMDPKAR